MPKRRAKDGQIHFNQTPPVHHPDRLVLQVEVGKTVVGPNERVPPHHRHLQGRVLGNHAVLHQRGHEQARVERQKTAVTDDAQHHLTALHNVDITPDNAIGNHNARPNINIITNRRRPVDRRRRVNRTILPDLHQGGRGQKMVAPQLLERVQPHQRGGGREA